MQVFINKNKDEEMRKMKKLTLLSILLLTCGAMSFAQNDNKVELFGGYSYENINSGITGSDFPNDTGTNPDRRFNGNGFNVAGTSYFTKRFGITADFSANFQSRNHVFDTEEAKSKLSLYNITAGPQFRFSNASRFTPFVHGLAGIAHRNLRETFTDTTMSNFGTTAFEDNGTSFALNLGGGVDYRLNDRFSLRIVQLDYNPIFLSSRTIDTVAFPSQTLNGFRFSTGIVIK
jgi:opacity protein-like surface antigen